MVKAIKIVSDDSSNDSVGNIKDFYDVEEFVIDKLQLHQRPTGMKVYKLEQVGNTDPITDSDTIVAECPDNLVRKQISSELQNLKNELSRLREKLAVSDILREDALQTVNRLRQEVIDFTHRNEESVSPSESLKLHRRRKCPSSYPNSNRHSSQSLSRAVWRN